MTAPPNLETILKTELLTENIVASKYQILLGQDTIFNPSVTWLGNQKIFIARRSSLKTINGGLRYEYTSAPNTENLIFICDKDNNLITTSPLNDLATRKLTGIADCGLEDIRLFVIDGALYGICAGLSFPGGIYKPKQIIIEIKQNTIVNAIWLSSPTNSDCEKNWAPLVSNHNLYLFYGLDPLSCLEIRGNQILLKKGVLTSSSQIKLRGGTPFITIKDKHICLGHYEPIMLDQRYYRHSFVMLDNEFNILEISRPFFIQQRGLEFATGLCVSDEIITLSYGVSDKEAHYLDFSINELQKYLLLL
jgi:predicted GH43/DUF377 family glycosyl hydrolase